MSTTRIASPTIAKAGASYSSSSSLEEGNSSNSSSMGQRGNHCEECMKQPAKWYCVADEAYLCELCDAIVHSSNCVAKRHKRIRVDDMNIAEVAETSTTTSSSTTTSTTTTTTTTSATAATTRKRPRTSWGRPHSNYSTLSLRTIPRPPITPVKQEITSDFFLSTDVLPSFLADMDLPLHDMPRFLSMADDTAFFPPPSIDCCKSSPPSPSQTLSGFSPVSTTSTLDFTGDDEINCFGVPEDYTVDDLLTGCFYELHRDLHLIMGETKADMCLDMDLMDTPTSNDNSNITSINSKDNKIISIANDSNNIDIVLNSVKVEVGGYTSESSDLSSEDLEEEYTINLSDFEPDESLLPDDLPEIKLETENDRDNRNCLQLSLNFTDVLSAWSEKDSPWLDGKRPEGIPDLQLPKVIWHAEEVRPFVPFSSNYGESFVNLDLLTAMGTCAGMGKTHENRISNMNSNSNNSGGREARVMRYREKRRTRLFSKKIRYEVRKLNAERRPRMKGRFIKRILGATDSS